MMLYISVGSSIAEPRIWVNEISNRIDCLVLFRDYPSLNVNREESNPCEYGIPIFWLIVFGQP